jgi:thiamine pyrophosphate-dependent acetolactate synthase large subunit-like protein
MTEAGLLRVERRELVRRLVESIPDALIVSGLGSPSYDLFATGDRDLNFYLWGAMGGASSLALGLALAQPDRSVVAITGDGEQLMGLGSLATIGAQQPPNLTLVVLDNGRYGETGMQPSHTALGSDLVTIAKGCGITDAFPVERLEQSDEIAGRVNARAGVALARVLVEADEPPRTFPSRDGSFVKNRFRAALGFKPF